MKQVRALMLILIEGKSVLGFEMKVITEKLRHPSMRFYAEDDGFAGKLKP